MGIWKIGVIRKSIVKGKCPLFKEEENVIHILLKYKETKRRRKQFLNDEWLHINEEISCKIKISYNKNTELKN